MLKKKVLKLLLIVLNSINKIKKMNIRINHKVYRKPELVLGFHHEASIFLGVM